MSDTDTPVKIIVKESEKMSTTSELTPVKTLVKIDQITPEIKLSNSSIFLIRINREETTFVYSEDEAKLVIDSMAAHEQQRLEDDIWTKVYRRDVNDGKKAIISTQKLGYLSDGNVVDVVILDFVQVTGCTLIKGRHEKPKSHIPPPPPIPSPQELFKATGKSPNPEEDEYSEESDNGSDSDKE